MKHATSTRTRHLSERTPRGMGLLEGLIAVAILSFGMLGLARFQTTLMAQTTDSRSRTTATQLADELLSTVLVDTANAGCYTLPNPGSCTSSAAVARAADWKVRALAALPGDHTAVAALDTTTQRFTVTVTWTGKGGSDPHTLQVSTDAR
jgi:type IV pilus assembly protein PilV